MILYKMFKLWYLRSKWQLAFYQFIDQLAKNPEDFEKKLVHEIAEVIHNSVQKQDL